MNNPQISTLTLKNFDIKMLGDILSQSNIVNSQLMLEFKNEMVKSASFSPTKSLIKLVSFPISDLIEDFDENPQDLKDFNFDCCILRGDAFLKHISVFGKDNVDMIFTLRENEGEEKTDKLIATSLNISGLTEQGSKINVNFNMTTEELISDKISDFSALISLMTPTEDMTEIMITEHQTSETKSLVRKLHSSVDKNTSFLSFKLNKESITVSDSAFNTSFENTQPQKFKSSDEIGFNILKNDFVVIGEHNFLVYTSDESKTVIFIAKHKKSVIVVMATKLENSSEEEFDDASFSQYGFND